MSLKTKYPLSPEITEAIQQAQSRARHLRHKEFGGAHLLWALMREESGMPALLEDMGKNVAEIRNWADFQIKLAYPKNNTAVEEPMGDQAVLNVFREANHLRLKQGEATISPVHALQAISTPDVAFAEDKLKHFPLSPADFESMAAGEHIQNAIRPGPAAGRTGAQAVQALLKYCEDLTEKARKGAFDPLIGREKELRQMIEVLGKRISPNVMLVGEPGVGKSALAEGLAQMIISGQVPPDLEEASLFQLDINKDLVAGASYKGEVEERLKQIVKAAENYPQESGGKKAILFIDEIHALLDKDGSVGSGAVNLLKPGLARGDLKVIGATTQAEYRKYVETDSAFKRRFTKVTIEEPTDDQAIEIIEGIASRFEDKHQIRLDRPSIPEAVRLAKRYLSDKGLPASAVELMDLTLRAVSVANSVSSTQLSDFEKALEEIKTAEETLRCDKLRYLYGKIRESVSPVLMGRLEADSMEESDDPAVMEAFLSRTIESLRELTGVRRDVAEKEDLTAVIAEMSGIPLGKIRAQELEKLKNMEASLRERVVGQDHALLAVANGIRRARVGLKDNPGEPIGSFLFLGPTATGKTELAKAIAGLIFDSEKALLRFDMSEFQESHTVSRLLGAPPGYVGYEEGGALINMIRQKPYSVVLFDEIEKAHPKVLDIFLQLLQDGRLTDNSTGKLGDFSNAVIVFTSNVGSRRIVESEDGKDPREMIEELRPFLLDHGFKPEFLRRMTAMIAFRPISLEVAEKIVRLKLKTLCNRLKKQQGIMLELNQGAVQLLVEKGYDKEFGAGPLMGAIQDHVTSPMTDILINRAAGSFSTITVTDSGKDFAWEVK